MGSGAEALERWNVRLAEPLSRTVAHARENIPYYRGLLPQFEAGGSVAEQLAQLPLLTKALAIRNKEWLRATPEKGWMGRFSTGTTRQGPSFLDVRSTVAESRAIEAFFRHQRDFGAASDPTTWIQGPVGGGGVGPRVLAVESQHYEAGGGWGPGSVTQVAWSHHPNCLQSLRTLLSLSPGDGGFSVLRIEPGPLAKLTQLLGEPGLAALGRHLELIGIHGYLSPRWRRRFEALFGAHVVEVFSLSEFRSVARECEAGGHFHFDELPLVTEVLDPVDQVALSEGWGELVLSSLYPFSQEQPLLRYATGDLVRIIPCERHPELGFRWESRLQHALPLGSGRYVGDRAFMDAADEHPDVARSGDDFERLGLIPAGTVGWPAIRLELATTPAPKVRAHLSLNYPPWLFPERAGEVRASLGRALLEAQLDLPAVELEVLLHGPGEDQGELLDWWRFARPTYPYPSIARPPGA